MFRWLPTKLPVPLVLLHVPSTFDADLTQLSGPDPVPAHVLRALQAEAEATHAARQHLAEVAAVALPPAGQSLRGDGGQ